MRPRGSSSLRRNPPAGGVLTLTGLEHMCDAEKNTRIKAVVNDMAASIIYIAKQAEAGNLTADQTTPLYNLLADIATSERDESSKLRRELRVCKRRLAERKRQHKRDIEALMQAAAAELRCLNKKLKELHAQMETDPAIPRKSAARTQLATDIVTRVPADAVRTDEQHPGERSPVKERPVEADAVEDESAEAMDSVSENQTQDVQGA
ncbi:hypothetical protein VTO42DRAFT_5785 [Malbranchea cinnamomea]